MSETSAWYAILVRQRCEARVVHSLSAKGFEAFLPHRSIRRQYSDRVKATQLPLFPGYIFCRFARQHQFLVLNVPGVMSIASDYRGPIAVPAAEIDIVRRLSATEVCADTLPLETAIAPASLSVISSLVRS
jgi:transcription antitermination factor NusG